MYNASMSHVGLPWKACVLTAANKPSDHADLKNAMLYASNVNWIPCEIPASTVLVDAFIQEKSLEVEFKPEEFRPEDVPGFTAYWETVGRLLQELLASGLADRVSVCLPPINVRFGETYPHLGTGERTFSHPVFSDLFDRLGDTISECRIVISDSRLQRPRSSEYWNSYDAAGHLLETMPRLLLPDVSELPVTVLAEMRDRLEDTLDPMRAEMLRFTEDLRELIGDREVTSKLLAAEARNLIATRVEPVVREANHRVSEMRKDKFGKLFASAAKAFGFAGAAFIDPKMIAKAVQQTLEVGALAFNDAEDDSTVPRATAQFVLQAKTLMPSA
jgi:hypothetical protein